MPAKALIFAALIVVVAAAFFASAFEPQQLANPTKGVKPDYQQDKGRDTERNSTNDEG